MKKYILTALLLLPHVLFANAECWLEEYPDHYVAECTGDKINDSVVTPSSLTTQSAHSVIPAPQAQLTGPIHITKKAPSEETISMAVENFHRPVRMSHARVKSAIIERNKLLQLGE